MDKQYISRRSFLQNTARAALVMSTADLSAPAVNGSEQTIRQMAEPVNQPIPGPWYKTVTRWGQVNITEKDPPQYDIPWWRNYWKRTATNGIIVNAGGIVAYYPTKIPFHKKPCIYRRGMICLAISAALPMKTASPYLRGWILTGPTKHFIRHIPTGLL